MLLELELAMRATPGLSSLLAPVPVLQDLFVFGARERPRAQGNAAPSLSVVVIAFDEEACLAAVVRELVDRLAREGIDFEVVLVDDGSRDRTLPIMRELAAHDPRLSVVALSPNRGIGGALRAGFDAARGEYVTWVPADGQIDPATVVELYRRRAEALMLTTVYVARDDALYRTWISRTLNALIRLRTGEVAKSGGNYLFHRSAWEHHAPLADDTMMISTAFRARLRAAGEAIVEVPIRARARAAGHSKVLNARTILRTLLATARLRRS
jgi:glycosyltransferase involved in cell wall biosynthesis